MAFDPNKCLRLELVSGSYANISLGNSGADSSPYYFSKDNGATWTEGNQGIALSLGDVLYIRGTNYPTQYPSTIRNFAMNSNGTFKLSGSIMSLLDDGAGTATAIPMDYAFYSLFKEMQIEEISGDVLTATTLKSGCYMSLFEGNTELTSVDKDLLSAATELKSSCYSYMFKGCVGLTEIPTLPATTMASQSYYCMFQGCTGLTKIGKDDFLVETLSSNRDLGNLFDGCSNIKEIHVHFHNWGAAAGQYCWAQGVAATGKFYCPSDFPEDYGTHKIPTGWTIVKPKRGGTICFLNKVKTPSR